MSCVLHNAQQLYLRIKINKDACIGKTHNVRIFFGMFFLMSSENLIRSSQQRCSIKKVSCNIHRKTLIFCSLKVCNFIKKRLQHRRFPVNIAKFLRAPILKNICERLRRVPEGCNLIKKCMVLMNI